MQNNLKEIAQTQATKNSLMDMKSEILKNVSEIKSNMTGSGQTDEFDRILANYTEEQIANLTFTQAKKIFVDAEGNFMFDEKEFKPEMILDFIKYLKASELTFAKLDEEFAKLDESLAEYSKELEEIVSQKGSLNKTMVAQLTEQIEDESVPENMKEKSRQMLKGLENAKTLAPLFELYEKVSTQNTIRELKDESRRISTLKAYTRVCKQNGIEPKLLRFGGFEAILGEKYTVHKNLFVFIVARYIKYLDKDLSLPENKGFVIQLTNYLREIVVGEESEQYKADKEEIETLKTNICLLLDKFYN